MQQNSTKNLNFLNNWRPTSLSELTPTIFNPGLTHLGWEASNSFHRKFLIRTTESNRELVSFFQNKKKKD